MYTVQLIGGVPLNIWVPWTWPKLKFDGAVGHAYVTSYYRVDFALLYKNIIFSNTIPIWITRV